MSNPGFGHGTYALQISYASRNIRIAHWDIPGYGFHIPHLSSLELYRTRPLILGQWIETCHIRTMLGERILFSMTQQEVAHPVGFHIKGNVGIFTLDETPESAVHKNIGRLGVESEVHTLFVPTGVDIDIGHATGAVDLDGPIDGRLSVKSNAPTIRLHCRARMRTAHIAPASPLTIHLAHVTDDLLVEDRGHHVEVTVGDTETRDVCLRLCGSSRAVLSGTITGLLTLILKDQATVVVRENTDPCQPYVEADFGAGARLTINGSSLP